MKFSTTAHGFYVFFGCCWRWNFNSLPKFGWLDVRRTQQHIHCHIEIEWEHSVWENENFFFLSRCSTTVVVVSSFLFFVSIRTWLKIKIETNGFRRQSDRNHLSVACSSRNDGRCKRGIAADCNSRNRKIECKIQFNTRTCKYIAVDRNLSNDCVQRSYYGTQSRARWLCWRALGAVTHKYIHAVPTQCLLRPMR